MTGIGKPVKPCPTGWAKASSHWGLSRSPAWPPASSRVEVVTITSTPSRRNPVTNSGRRSGRPSPAAPRSDHEVAAFHVAELTHGLEKSAPHDFVRGDRSHREEADGDKPSLLAAPWRERAPSRDQKRCRR